jgi:histone H3/H4
LKRKIKMAKKAVEPLYVKSKVREYIKGKGCNTSSGVLDGETLNKLIMEMLDNAVRRAKGNNRKTVKARDL